MNWFCLILAGLLEIGWPLGLKLSQSPSLRLPGLALAAVSMALSGGLLWVAQRTISIGTAYAVWTGIGAAGTFLLGILVFGNASNVGRYLGVFLIVLGVVVLKLA